MKINGEKIALWLMVIGVITPIIIPEVRTFLGLERKEITQPSQNSRVSSENPKENYEALEEDRVSKKYGELPKKSQSIEDRNNKTVEKHSELPKENKSSDKPSSQDNNKPSVINHIGNKSFMNSEGIDIAVLIIDGEGNTEGVLTSGLARKYATQGMRTTTSLFNTRFVRSGAFDRLYQGDLSDASAFKQHVDKICLGKIQTNSRPSSQPDMIVVEAMLETRLINLDGSYSGYNDPITAKGTGWSEESAKQNAIQKLISSISNQ